MAKGKRKSTDKHGRIYVVAGKEETLVNIRCSELLDELIEPEQRVTGLFDVDGDKVSVSEVFDELRTLPFLAEVRVVLIKNAEKFVSANRELLEKYFDSPSSTGVLVLTVGTWDSRTRLAKKLGSVGTLIAVEQPKPWELWRHLVSYARDAYDKTIAEDAAKLLVDLAGDDLARLYGEVDKLALFADEEKCITTKHIESLIGHNRFFNAFAVIDACLAGDAGGATERLRRMFAEDKSSEYTVVGAFAYHFRKMWTAKKMLAEGQSVNSIAGKLRMWYNKEAQFRQVRKLSLKQIGDRLQELAGIDYAIKRGQAQPRVAMEQLVLNIAWAVVESGQVPGIAKESG